MTSLLHHRPLRGALAAALALALPPMAWASDDAAPPAPPAAVAATPADAGAAPLRLAQMAASSPALPNVATQQPRAAALLAAATAANAAGAGGRFDLAVSNAPASQVYMQLASGTAYNVLVSPEVTGTISITLKDTTVAEALDSLRELFGYDFRITGNRVFIYPNTVQTRLYRVNYLPGRRQGASDVRVTSSSITATGAGAGGSGMGGGQGASLNGSGEAPGARADDSARVRTTSDADFWREVQSSLTAMIGAAAGRSVVLNPAAGVVVVKATPNEQRQVEQYLRAVQLSIERQVMLEAKIIEVALSRDSQSGINWGGFTRLNSDRVGVAIGSVAPGTTLATQGALTNGDAIIDVGKGVVANAIGRGFYGLALQATNFAALLNFLQTQGDVSVLSSPRIATLNNQKAVLKVGSDEMFVTGISTSTTSAGNSSVSTPTLTLQPFFSGVALDVTPQIDEGGHVILHVHPSISVVTEKTKAIDLGAQGNYRLPLATSAISQTDSIVRVRDGQIVAIGGLMTHASRADRSGVPVLQDAPVVGAAFRQSGESFSKRELVILMRPTVIHEDGPWPDAGGPPLPATQP